MNDVNIHFSFLDGIIMEYFFYEIPDVTIHIYNKDSFIGYE